MGSEIEGFKVKYISKKEADRLYEDYQFCPAYYPTYNGFGRVILYDGEIGCLPSHRTRYVLIKGE